MLKCFLLFFIIIISLTISVKSIKCYSCASKNMKQDFLTKNRGPKNRVQLPRLFDDSCHWDTWLLKDRGTVDCDGFCYKWQEALNNSGSYSYMTIRACSSHMFSTPAPINAGDIKGPGHSYCSEQIKSLDCLADSNLIDHQCWCQGDYCNSTSTINYSSSIFIILFSVLFIFIKFV
uniref:Protein quiver n=1 Tax=Parastrongyloides trichosuri TaxID=131310 RepID=A0A0N4ZLN9_PARTI